MQQCTSCCCTDAPLSLFFWGGEIQSLYMSLASLHIPYMGLSHMFMSTMFQRAVFWNKCPCTLNMSVSCSYSFSYKISHHLLYWSPGSWMLPQIIQSRFFTMSQLSKFLLVELYLFQIFFSVIFVFLLPLFVCYHFFLRPSPLFANNLKYICYTM